MVTIRSPFRGYNKQATASSAWLFTPDSRAQNNPSPQASNHPGPKCLALQQYIATPWVSELVSGQHKVYLLPTVTLFLQWTQPNTPKTEKSRPNPWVNPTHGQLWLAPMSTKTRRPSSRKSRRNRSIWPASWYLPRSKDLLTIYKPPVFAS